MGVSVTRGEAYDSVYYLADIHVRDVRALRTAFGGGGYYNGNEAVSTLARKNGAKLAVNGDYYSFRSAGPLVRNGEIYRDYVTANLDLLVLSKDGSMHALSKGSAKKDAVYALDPWQTWSFGPSLLDEQGKGKTVFQSELTKKNPRTAIGYYEPGHYALLVVDGRRRGYSEGMELWELSSLCEQLGMKVAYNLDGGQSTAMASQTQLINQPLSEGRPVSDIICVCEPEEEA